MVGTAGGHLLHLLEEPTSPDLTKELAEAHEAAVSAQGLGLQAAELGASNSVASLTLPTGPQDTRDLVLPRDLLV